VLERVRAPRALLTDPPGGSPLLIAARSRSGLYGHIVVVAAPAWSPAGRTQAIDVDDFASSPAGTTTDTSWNATDQVLELTAGSLAGSYEGPVQDLGYQAPAFWRVHVDRQELEDVTIADLDFEIGSGEARWRTLEGRPASAYRPGVDWQTRIEDLAMPIADLPDTLLIGGHVGEAGSHTQVLVETRFYVNGAWTAYREHVDRVVTASRMQVRLTLNRRSSNYRARVTRLRYEAFV